MSRKDLIFQHISAELATARSQRSDPDEAWKALERAHILSQGFAGAHVGVHWAIPEDLALILRADEPPPEHQSVLAHGHRPGERSAGQPGQGADDPHR